MKRKEKGIIQKKDRKTRGRVKNRTTNRQNNEAIRKSS